nr:MAG TPA: hypothetical protein [Caudoviricetes sp.]DAZ77003.1 MAG TPA: hypothetical protein [Caudoviricetes sp.]
MSIISREKLIYGSNGYFYDIERYIWNIRN